MRRICSLSGLIVIAAALFCSCSDDKTTEAVPPKAPTVATAAISAVTDTTAICGGNITSDGGAAITARGVCWSTNATPTTADNTTADGTGSGSFSSTLTDLTASTPYYVRAYATNSAGTGYGSAESFTTAAPPLNVILSKFDTYAEDWTVSGGAMYYQGSDGNTGGFIEFQDNEDQCGYFMAPAIFKGDLTEFTEGTLSFDLKNTNDNGEVMLACYGSVRISSGALSAEKNVVPYNVYLSDWTSFSIPLTADTWGVKAAQWDSILTNVTDLIIYMDTQMNYADQTGLDNFGITSASPGAQPSARDPLP